MKRLLLLAALLAWLAGGLSAQNLKGRFLLGISTQIVGNTFTENFAPNQVYAGQASTTTLKNNQQVGNLEARSYNFSPHIGYFFTDGLALGISTGVAGSHLESRQITDAGQIFYTTRRHTFHLAPALKYYFLPGSKVRPYSEARLLFAHTTSKVGFSAAPNPSSSEDAISASYWGLKAGAAWFLHEKVSLDAFFDLLRGGYSREDTGLQGGTLRYKTSFWGFGLGVSICL